MAGSLLERAFGIVGLLAANAAGLPLQRIVDDLHLPKSAGHRLLMELMRLGFARQDPVTGHYLLTTKLLSLGFTYLSSTGVIDVSQPILDGLARDCGELVRLTVVDGRQLTWVAKAQGVKAGLRYDPEMGQHPVLFCTATGQAWLATLKDEVALELVAAEGFGRFGEHGPNAPRTIQSFLKKLQRVRNDGYAMVAESAAVGASAMAAAIVHPSTGSAIGTVSIAGPIFRLSEAKMRELAPRLLTAAAELSRTSVGSDYLADVSRTAAIAHRSK